MVMVSGYTRVGGVHPESAAFKNVLHSQGVSLSEAMIFGIAGGLGMGYILWEFQEHHAKVLVVAFQNRWNYPMDYYQHLADRLGITIAMPDTGSKKAAAQILNDALDRGLPVIAWVDRASLPYMQMPLSMIAHIGHIISICGRDGDTYFVDDLAAQPIPIDANTLADARARISSYKSRLVVIDKLSPSFDLPAAIHAGLQDQVEYLSSPSESFSLPAIRKWAKTMIDAKGKKGWLKVFEDRRGLMSTLMSLFESVELSGAPGDLRGLYADFLTEAASVIGNSRLSEPADHYRKLAGAWSQLAESALPDDVPLLREMKALLRQRDLITKRGGEAWRDTANLTAQITEKRREGNLNFPLDDAAVLALFTTLHDQLNAIYQAEVEALEALKAAL